MMRFINRSPATSGPSETGGTPRTGFKRYSLVLLMLLPVVAWSGNDSMVAQNHGGTDAAVNETRTAGSSETGQPVATLSATSDSGRKGEYDLALGKSVFNHTCLTCHGNSVLDAPRVGDMRVWQPRLAQGLDVLIQHALNGHGRMPAKGGYSSLTDDEVSSAVAYVYYLGTDILAKQDTPAPRPGCDPVSSLDQCSPEELKRLLVLQMLWLLGGPRQ